MTLGELFEETYIQGEIAIRSYDSTGRMTCTGCTSRTTGKKRRNRFERNGLSMS